MSFRFKAIRLASGSLALVFLGGAFSTRAQLLTNSPTWDFGDGRHGSFVLTSNATIAQLYAAVRRPTDSAIYDPFNSNAVPQFVNLTITNVARLTLQPWNGTSGGVLVVKATGKVTVCTNAAIDASGAGYRGGANPTMRQHGLQGESYAGAQGFTTASNYGGGGGGKNTPGEYGWHAGGGGGGGYGTAGLTGTTGSGEYGWQLPGEGGGTYGEIALLVQHLGSGGGQGGGAWWYYGGTGGNGGGAISITAFFLAIDGTVQANGGNGAQGNGGTAGTGGGGSGGSVLIRCFQSSLGIQQVTATGGSDPYRVGVGGGGRIRLVSVRMPAGTTSPSASLATYSDWLDTDRDGIPDATEVGADAARPLDTDNDGIPDYRDPDSDNDGMPDSWERENGLNPIVNDAHQDADADGLTNIQERQYGTNPQARDSNDDGRPDGMTDSDGDGFSDVEEFLRGTNPYVVENHYCYDRNNRLVGVQYTNRVAIGFQYDGNGNLVRQMTFNWFQDNNGLPALWKFLSGLDPTNSAGTNALYADADGDGWSNYQEWQGGSSPTNAASMPSNTVQTAPLVQILPDPNQGWALALVRLRLLDGEGNNALPFLQYSNAVTLGWRDATLPLLDGTNVALLPRGVAAPLTGAVHEVHWDTHADLGGYAATVWLRSRARDCASTNLLGPWSDAIPYEVVPLADADGDGLLYAEEIAAGTDPLNPDSDGDGLTDGAEVHTHHSNPLLVNTDGDQVTDSREVQDGTDPADPGSFRVSIVAAGIYSLNAGGGVSGNGLLHGTFTLGQGCPAGANGTSALFNLSGFQATFALDDTDADGLPDELEWALGCNPLLRDTDGDGLDDFQEWLAGTNPNDPASVFRVSQILANTNGPGFIIVWDTAEGRFYTVSTATNLPPAWLPVYQAPGDGTPQSYTDTNAVPQKFFRLDVTRP